MANLAEVYPVLGLRIKAGPIELRGIDDDLLGGLIDLVLGGIHDPEFMPFYFPWTDAPTEDLALNYAQYVWGVRSRFSSSSWSLPLAVLCDSELVGVQDFGTSDYLATRSDETGSWLGQQFQSRGIGTAMRQVMCAFLFDHLDAEEITSGAFLDNPSSLAVSRKVGYRPNGVVRFARRGTLALNQRLTLTPAEFVRGEHPLVVEGVEPLRRAIGLTTQNCGAG